ncbi:hypothetical protein SUDANB120_04800 [Streptomyces sp. enrichment culture]|uniref:hypothetical protein n=1 Tax=Streptomyces TaxID=1883 RepID=UPI0016735A70|nr:MULTISPECIES: hypothetical protein [Streptomyces]MBD3577857.1 hypothetical protein [Streptomyces sp. KD18]GGS99825.1 hypothetical protein GCM10010286_25960 [Streptomyces toxytricini]
MSHESAPEQPGRDDMPRDPAPADPPKGVLQQMEDLMAALNADLSRLDAELQSPTDRNP